MQTLADPGASVISEGTRRLVEGYFALKPLGPSRIKGVSEPVNVYEVTGLGPLRRDSGNDHFIREVMIDASLSASNTTDSSAGFAPCTSLMRERNDCITNAA